MLGLGRRVAAGASAEEGAVAEADATGVVVCRQAGSGPADSVETRDAMACAVERGAIGVGTETAEREGRVDRAVVDP